MPNRHFASLSALIFALSACSSEAHDCAETRNCPEPIGYIDAGSFGDWWDAGAAGQTQAEDPGKPADPAPGGTGGTLGAAASEAAIAGMAGEGGAAASESTPNPVAPSAPSAPSASVAVTPVAVAPVIVSVNPLDGELGVRSDAKLVITFNEAMDPASLETAYHSSDLPLSAVHSAWNAEHTVLTLTPNLALVYATSSGSAGAGVTFPAKTYHWGFNDLARDSEGQTLAGVDFAFSTLRQVDLELAADPMRTGNWTDGEGEGIHNCVRGAKAPYAPSVCVGDDVHNIRYTGFVSFDLSQLPGNAVQILSARLLASGVAYGAVEQLGPNRLEHVVFGDLAAPALSVPASANLGTFYGIAAVPDGTHFELNEDLTDALQADCANRYVVADRSQYRLSFTNIDANGTWDDVELSTSTIRLAASYLTP